MNKPAESSRWFLCRARRPDALVRLFCIPFAGGGASAFNAWPSVLPETVELHAIQLPGRESRYREPAFMDAHVAARGLADAIIPYLDRRYAVFGYSMGALIAFELVRELRRRGERIPDLLFVAAKSGPQKPTIVPPLSHLPHEDFLDQVRYYYEPPEEIWTLPDLAELILPPLRADMTLCENYIYQTELPLACPIQVFAGLRDRSAPMAAVQSWREQTLGDFDIELFDDGHFFINSALATVQQRVVSRIGDLLEREKS